MLVDDGNGNQESREEEDQLADGKDLECCKHHVWDVCLLLFEDGLSCLIWRFGVRGWILVLGSG